MLIAVKEVGAEARLKWSPDSRLFPTSIGGAPVAQCPQRDVRARGYDIDMPAERVLAAC